MNPGWNRHQMLIRYTLLYLDFPGYTKAIFLATRAFTRDKKVKTNVLTRLFLYIFLYILQKLTSVACRETIDLTVLWYKNDIQLDMHVCKSLNKGAKQPWSYRFYVLIIFITVMMIVVIMWRILMEMKLHCSIFS